MLAFCPQFLSFLVAQRNIDGENGGVHILSFNESSEKLKKTLVFNRKGLSGLCSTLVEGNRKFDTSSHKALFKQFLSSFQDNRQGNKLKFDNVFAAEVFEVPRCLDCLPVGSQEASPTCLNKLFPLEQLQNHLNQSDDSACSKDYYHCLCPFQQILCPRKCGQRVLKGNLRTHLRFCDNKDQDDVDLSL